MDTNTSFPKLSETVSSKPCSIETIKKAFNFKSIDYDKLSLFSEGDNRINDIIQDCVNSENAQIEAWLIEKFGSYENAMQLAHLFVLEYDELKVTQNENGTLTATQNVRIRHRTKEEREEFQSYSD